MVAQLLGASAALPEDAHLIATVHNELILDCPADTAEQCRNIAEAAMKEAFVRDVWRHRSVEVESRYAPAGREIIAQCLGNGCRRRHRATLTSSLRRLLRHQIIRHTKLPE